MGKAASFAVIHVQPRSPEGMMERMRGAFNADSGVITDYVTRYGTRIFDTVIEIPEQIGERKVRRRVHTALRFLADVGIKTVIVSSPCGEEEVSQYLTSQMPRYELRPPDRSRLLRRNAGKMALCALGYRPEAKTAALYTARVTREFDDAVRLLLGNTRYLAIDCTRGGEEYAAGLLAEFGVSVLTNPSAFQYADVHLLFDHTDSILTPIPAATVLSFCSDIPALPCRVVTDAEFSWPTRLGVAEGLPQGEMAAALFECGAVDAGELEVTKLK